MKKISLFLIVIAFTNLKAQIAYSWAKQTGGTNTDDSQCIAYDASGNVYIAGSFQGTVDFDPGVGTTTLVSAGSDDAFISKFDANGNFLAVYTFTNNLACKIYGIAIDNSGNIITTGGFSGSVDFDPTASVTALTSNGANDIFVVKLNSTGTLAWAKAIGSFGSDDYGISVTTDASANVLVTGYFQGSNVNFDVGGSNFTMSANSGAKDVFVLKLTTVGVFSWAFKIGSPSTDVGQSIKTDLMGNIYVGGYFSSNPDFDPGPGGATIISSGGNDAFVAKYTSAGTYVWANSFSGALDEVCYGIIIDASGDIYSTGTFKSNTDFDPSAGTFNLSPISGTNEDVFISKINSSGAFIWAKQIGGINSDFGTGISADASGVYITGYFSGTADFDPASTATVNLVSNGGNDFFVSKLDVNGNYIFSKNSGGVGNDIGRAIITPSTNIIYSTGSFSNTVDFDISPLATNTISSNGNSDAFLVKYMPCPAQTVSISASSPTICVGGSSNLSVSGAVNYTWSTGATINSITVNPTITTTYSTTGQFTNGCFNTNTLSIQVTTCTGLVTLSGVDAQNINIFPSPANTELNVELLFLNGASASSATSILITNSLGQIVYNSKINTHKTVISISDLPVGIYFVTIKSGTSSLTKKIIIEY